MGFITEKLPATQPNEKVTDAQRDSTDILITTQKIQKNEKSFFTNMMLLGLLTARTVSL